MPITYSISGGADAAKFTIDGSTGKLVFKAAPDFEAPGDANKDNVYELTVKVVDSNGKATTKNLRVSCTDVIDMNADSPPQITSAATASVPENTTVVMTVTAVESGASGSGGGTQPPQPGQDTSGRLTQFSANATMIDTFAWQCHSARKAYSMTKIDDYELRFELHEGDRRSNDGDYCDRSSLQHCDQLSGGLATMRPVGAVVSERFWLLIEPGTPAASYFFVLGQAHNDDGAANAATSPPVALEFTEEKFRIFVRHCPSNQNPGNNAGNLKTLEIWKSPTQNARGAWNEIKIEAKNKNDSSGYCKVWFNGAQVANYIGPVGFGYSWNWEFGPYRATDPTVFAVHYRNIVHT